MNRSVGAARAVRISVATLVLCLALLLAPRAHADNLGSQVVQNSVLVSGSSSTVYSMNVQGPGVLTVTLENISWPERLASLDCSIYSHDGLLNSLAGGGEWKFVTTGPGSFYASVLAGAGGRLNMGLFSIRMKFESAGSVVPLPAAGWLLASVLGLFGFQRTLPALRFAFGREQLA